MEIGQLIPDGSWNRYEGLGATNAYTLIALCTNFFASAQKVATIAIPKIRAQLAPGREVVFKVS